MMGERVFFLCKLSRRYLTDKKGRQSYQFSQALSSCMTIRV